MSNKMEEVYKVHKNLPEGEVVLDVRRPDEYSQGHVPGSINIPHDQILSHLEDLKAYKKIYLHCRSGKRAQFAAHVLTENGFSNIFCVDDSGFLHWDEKGYQCETC